MQSGIGDDGGRKDLRKYFVETADGDAVGTGTNFPLGFDLGKIVNLFLNAKKLRVSGSLPGQVSADSYLTFWDNVFGVFPAQRAYLFVSMPAHVQPTSSTTPGAYKAIMQIGGSGRTYNGKFYPYVSFFFSGTTDAPDDEDAVIYNYNIFGAGVDPQRGSLNVLGESTPLYSAEDAPEGDADVEITEEWTA